MLSRSEVEERRWLMAQRLKSRDLPAGELLTLWDVVYSAIDTDPDGMRAIVWLGWEGALSRYVSLIRRGVLRKTGRWDRDGVEYAIDVRAIPARHAVARRLAQEWGEADQN